MSDLATAILSESEVAVFENLYVAYADETRRVARAILGDTELAADAVHTGFLEMLRYVVAGRRRYDPDDARSMVLRNVRWAALKARRSRSRVSGAFQSVSDDSDVAAWAQAELRAMAEDIVSRLNARDREAIWLRYVEGLSNAEAAQRLGVKVDAFESRLRQALRAARRVAGGSGLAPCVDAVRARLGRMRVGAAVRGAVTTAAVATLAAGALAGVAQATTQHSRAAPPRLVAAHTTTSASLDPIGNARIVDAVALPSRALVALGVGYGCDCPVLYRSVDGGATWSSAPGPSRLDLAGGRHATPCSAASVDVYCHNHAVAAVSASSAGGRGAVLDMGTGRRLFILPLGGVLCSADAGITWTPTCPPIR